MYGGGEVLGPPHTHTLATPPPATLEVNSIEQRQLNLTNLVQRWADIISNYNGEGKLLTKDLLLVK